LFEARRAYDAVEKDLEEERHNVAEVRAEAAAAQEDLQSVLRETESLVLLGQQEQERLSKERKCSIEAELSNLAWARMSCGADLGFHWFDHDGIWANSFWEFNDIREQERVQKEHLDRFAALLGDAEVAAEAAAVFDDGWEQLRLDALGPERWKKAVESMCVQSACNDSRTQGGAIVAKKDKNPAQTELDARHFRQLWWPLSTANKIKGCSLFTLFKPRDVMGR